MLSILNSKKALLVFIAFLFVFGSLLPALAITSGESTLPRISYWPGKVNQHTENGVWKTDPDGVSGSYTSWTAANILTYCKKWYPNTTSVEYDGTIATIDWKAAYNTGSYSSIRPVYKCVEGVTAVPVLSNFNISYDNSARMVKINADFDQPVTEYIYFDGQIKTTYYNVTNDRSSINVDLVGAGNSGPHTLRLKFCSSSQSSLCAESDNKSYTVSTVAGKPDLKIEKVEVTPTSDTINVYYTNAGTANAKEGFRLKLNDQLTNFTDFQYIQEGAEVNVGERRLLQFSLQPGTYNLLFTIDDTNIIDESNESNNNFPFTFTVPSTDAKPDLMITRVAYTPVNPKSGDMLNLTVTVKNIGAKDVSGLIDFSPAMPSYTINGLKAGEEKSITIYSAVGYSHPGLTEHYTYVDPFNKIDESNEDNNSNKLQLTISPNFVGDGTYDLGSWRTVQLNNGLTLFADGQNISGQTPYKVHFRVFDKNNTEIFDTPYLYTGNTYQGNGYNIKVNSINSYGSINYEWTVNITVKSTADVQKPDLTFTGADVYQSDGVTKFVGDPKVGDTFSVRPTLKNIGTAISPVSYYMEHYIDGVIKSTIPGEYYPTMKSNDTYLGMGTNLSYNQPGTHEYKFVVDSKNQIDELDESNNTLTKIVNVTSATDTNCQITLEGITYKLSPCEVNTSMTDGAGDKEFSFKIDQVSETRSYGFGVYGYGEGFPTYGIITTPSSGAYTGDLSFKSVFKDQILNAENNQTKSYTGYLPIKIYYGSAGTGVEKTLKLMVNVNVSPAANLDSTPRISYWPGKVNQHTENGVWKTDPDGVSGSYTSWTIANILTYCKKWYPNTTSVEADGTISTIDWKAAGNTGSYSSIRPVYKCVQPTNKADLKITDLFLEDGLVKANYCNVGNYQPLISGSPATFYIKLSANGAVHTGTSNNSNHVFSVPAPGECQKTDGIPASYFNFVGGRSYLVEANIDWENRVAESNENNNIFSKVVTPESIPVSGLSLVKNSAYGNQNFVPPATQAKVASFIVSAGANSGVDIDTINISQATSGVMQNMKLMTGSTQSGATKVTLTSSNTTENVFTISNLNLAAGESKIVDVYADIKANPDSSSFTLAINALGTNSQGVAVSTTDQAMQTIRLVNGSLSASADSSQPVSGLVVAGTTAKMNAIKFTATNEAFTITKLRISESNPENLDSIAKVILEYKDKGGNTNIKEAYLNNDNVVDFTGLNMYVPKDGSAILTVKAEIPTIASGADSGDTPGLDFSSVNFSALGESSNVAKISGLSNVMGNDMVVRKSIPTITTQSLPTTILSNGTQILYKFRVLVDPAGDIAWQKISLQLKTDGAVGIAGGSLYSETDQSTKLGTGTIDDALIMEFSLPTAEIVAAGSMKTYVIKATVTNATNSMVSLTSLGDGGSGTMVPDSVADISDHSNFIWSDMSKVPALTSLTDNVWLDGSLVKTFGDSAVLISTSYAAPVALSKAESVIGTEDSAPSTVMNIGQRLSGRLLLAVEDRGRIFYVYPVDYKKYEVTFGNITELFESLALGISNSDLDKILINPDSVSADKDSDGDGFNDKSEVANGYNPYLASDPANRGNDKVVVDNDLANRLIGRLLLQVEDRGRIWYVDQAAKRWEVTWENVMNLFTSLSLGISNEDLAKMENGN